MQSSFSGLGRGDTTGEALASMTQPIDGCRYLLSAVDTNDSPGPGYCGLYPTRLSDGWRDETATFEVPRVQERGAVQLIGQERVPLPAVRRIVIRWVDTPFAVA